MIRRFQNFSVQELQALEAVFSRVGGFPTSPRGECQQILEEVRNEMIEQRTGRPVQCHNENVTGSIYFQKDWNDG